VALASVTPRVRSKQGSAGRNSTTEPKWRFERSRTQGAPEVGNRLMRTRRRTPALAAALVALALLVPDALASSTTSGGTTAPSGTSTSPTTTPTPPSGATTPATPSPNAKSGSGRTSTTHAYVPTPTIIAIDCYRVGVTSCAKNPRSVQVTGELVVHGHHLSSSLSLYFPKVPLNGGHNEKLGVALHPTSHGLAATVPAGVHSGHVFLQAPSGTRSRLYGPIEIRPAPVVVSAVAPPVAAPFAATAMWIWYLDQSDDGNLTAIAAAAQAAGVKTLFIKSSDGDTGMWSQFTPSLIQSLHALGFDVCAWQYVYGADPVGEAALGAQAVADGADCLVIDAEKEYEGNYWAAQTYIQDLRAAIGPSFPVGLSSFPYVNLHEAEPYSVFLGPGGAQYDIPQVYWKAIGTTPDAAYAHTYVENEIYGRPILPVGQAYNNVSPAQMTRFRQLASAYGAAGLSWWSFQAMSSAGWAALDAPMTAGAAVTIPTAWLALSSGARGDQVIWMQEHLAAAEPTTPTTGDFDATTEANLKAFQAENGIAPSGVTDEPTWLALLKLTPVQVQYPAPAGGSTGSSGTSGSSGSSGSTGTAGPGGGTSARG